MFIKGAIFDIDGTVLDSMSIWNSAGVNYLRSIGIDASDDLNEVFKTMSMTEGARYFQEVFGVQLSLEEIIDGVNRMVETMYFNSALPKKDAKEFLEYLSEQNVLICGVTSTDEYLVKAALKRNGILSYFSKIFTCTQIGKGKTQPDIYYAALKHLGTTKENTVIFEDAHYAIQTAKKAGYIVAAIYDAFEPKQEEIKSLANYYFLEYNDFIGQIS